MPPELAIPLGKSPSERTDLSQQRHCAFNKGVAETMKLKIGEFLGTQIRQHSTPQFTFTEYRYSPEMRLASHSHERAYFSFALAGSYEEYGPNSGQICDTRAGLFHPADERHSDHFGACGGHIFSIEIGPDALNKARAYGLNVDRRVVLRTAAVGALRRRAYSAFVAGPSAIDLVLEAVGLELLYQLGWPKSHVAERHAPRWLTEVTDIIHSDFRSKITMVSLAERVGIHPVHLARTFKRHRGVTIGEYVRNLRVENALNELLNSSRSLSEIALHSGFCDQSHFGRMFKMATALTPKQLRRSRC